MRALMAATVAMGACSQPAVGRSIDHRRRASTEPSGRAASRVPRGARRMERAPGAACDAIARWGRGGEGADGAGASVQFLVVQ